MGIKKTKKIKVWCSETPIFLEEVYHPFQDRSENPIKDVREKAGLPKMIRCPECNRRLRPKIVESQDHGDWYVSIPAHKKLIKKA